MPGRRVPGLGVEKAHGDLPLPRGLVNGETQVVGECLLDSPCKGLISTQLEKTAVSGVDLRRKKVHG